jgi:muconolactone delta-isomerase
MEYLVEMITRVPDGVSEAEVIAMRARESANTRQLVAAGRVLRLWRPVLRPGEWRTIGLFTAGDRTELGHILGSMPLHVWREDVVTPLRPHHNDPGVTSAELDPNSVEFLTTFVLEVPDDASVERVAELTAREAGRTRELAAEGNLLRLWALPGNGHNLGLWQARDPSELQHYLESLPLSGWLTVTTERLTPHPSDPSLTHGTRSHR